MVTIFSQPQIAQLDIQFPAPLDKNSVVNEVSDLLNLNFNYPHRRVWVKSETCEYYLDPTKVKNNVPIGSQLEHWQKVTAKITIEEYDQNKAYLINDVVMVKMSGKLYRAIDNVPADNRYNPVRNPRIWQPIVGDIETHMFMIDNQSEITISTDQQNPMFRVYQTVQLDEGSETFEIECKITEVTPEISPDITIGDDEIDEELEGLDIEDDDDSSNILLSKHFKFEFFENSVPAIISGYIIMK